MVLLWAILVALVLVLLMEELCFGVGTKKLDKMVAGWDSERSEADDLNGIDVTKRDSEKLQNVISTKYSNSDLTS